MGRSTKIDWCDSTWNPVTGCRHGCEYCYARRIAERYGGGGSEEIAELIKESACGVELASPIMRVQKDGKLAKAPYPYGFEPTFHRYKLDTPKRWKEPRTVFVCSMADLFGWWVPDRWIEEVIRACDQAPQHRYIFLTKAPERYLSLPDLFPVHRRPHNCAEMWFGMSYTGNGEYWGHNYPRFNRFVSVEPLLAEPPDRDCITIARVNSWVIIGAETGNRKAKVIPRKEWVLKISDTCKAWGTQVFMKESLREIMGADFRQEFPWEV